MEDAGEITSFGGYFGPFFPFPSNRVRFYKIKLMCFWSILRKKEKKKSENSIFSLALVDICFPSFFVFWVVQILLIALITQIRRK